MTEFSTKKVTAKLFLLLVFSDVLETVTHVCFKKSVSAEMAFTISNAGAFFSFLHGVVVSPFLWLGLASVLCTFIIWTLILSRIDLSVAVHIASFSYILIPVVS
ncbi:MAG: hypothetical protein PHE58_01185, partial [Candidatus Omnitrophica bacterium]|nr:hypothetical protein [Candidatus Omnitrophota bacterium]